MLTVKLLQSKPLSYMELFILFQLVAFSFSASNFNVSFHSHRSQLCFCPQQAAAFTRKLFKNICMLTRQKQKAEEQCQQLSCDRSSAAKDEDFFSQEFTEMKTVLKEIDFGLQFTRWPQTQLRINFDFVPTACVSVAITNQLIQVKC